MTLLLGLVVGVLVICVVIWAVRALLRAFHIGEPLSTVIMVAVVIVCLLIVLNQLGVGGGILGG
jgi:uncharacterized membrane protein YwzB